MLNASRIRGAGLIGCCIAGLCLVLLGWGIVRWRAPRRLNLIVITLDTTRADQLGCYGHKAALTPAMDALAATGVLFERAYTVAPLTLPAHATLFTGLYPAAHGLRVNGKNRLDTGIATLAGTLAANGYQTAAFVASFVLDSQFGLASGFQVYDDNQSGGEFGEDKLHRQRSGRAVVDSALDWLAGAQTRPFFCWIHLYDPHQPYVTHADDFGRRFAEQPYAAEIAYVDLQVQRIVDFVAAQNLGPDTVLVIVGDHGEGLGEHLEREHGLMLYNSTLQVPLLLTVPGTKNVGGRVSTPVSLVDLMPTLLDCLKIAIPGKLSGRSLKAALEGATIDAVHCYAATDAPLFEHGWAPMRSLTNSQWKYIHSTQPELYDLHADPGELVNLAAANIAQVNLMRQTLQQMEAGFTSHSAPTLRLTAAEQRTLESLGYLGGHDRPDPVPGEAVPDIKQMIGHYNRALDAKHLADSGEVTEAIAIFAEIILDAPAYRRPQLQLGELLVRQGDVGAAVAIYERILAQEPDCAEVQIHLGNARAAQGRFEDALRYYLLASENQGDSAELEHNIGAILVHLRRLDEALTHFEQAVEHDRTFVPARLQLAALLAGKKRSGEAIAHYQTLLKIEPDLVEAHTQLAILLMGRNDYAEALVHFAKGVELNPQNPETHLNLGNYWALQGRFDRAAEQFAEALRLNPQHPQARVLLQRARDAAASGR